MEYQFESLGPAIRLVVLACLFVFALVALAVVVLVAALPGKIARSRNHPQQQAVNICGWVGLPTGILWAVALVWAYVQQTDQGHEVTPADKGKSTTPSSEGIDPDSQRVATLTSRLSELESRIEMIDSNRKVQS